MSRPRHPKKEIEDAVQYAESKGWKMSETHHFTLVLKSQMELPELEDAVFEAGCDDAILVQRAGTLYLEFDRTCNSLEDAILMAIDALTRAGIEILRIEPDDLVSAAEIARRAQVSREAVRLWTTGLRGQHFPPVCASIGQSSVWSWAEVVKWMVSNNKKSTLDLHSASIIAGLNLGLEMERRRAVPLIWSTAQRIKSGEVGSLEEV